MFSYLTVCLCFGLTSAIYYENKNVPAVLPQDQFFHYVSRPDFLVPRWDVTVFDRSRLSPGYWFTAPYDELGAEATTKPYVGPFIYDDNGELIWGAGSRLRNADAFDLRVTQINGVQHLTMISLLDKAALIMNQQYQILSRFPMQRDNEMANMHEFNLLEDGSRAFMFYNNRTQAPLDMSRDAGVKEGRCNVVTQSIVEFDTTNENHEKLWEWHLMDHIPLNESNIALNEINKECEKKHDFLHANSIDKCPDGDILISVRNTDGIYKINQTTGEIQWQLGGLASTIDHEGFIFTRQHNAGCHSANETHTVITLLDNANGEYNVYTNDYSRGMRISIDTVNRKATLEAEYAHPFKKVQVARGNCELLPEGDGNIFMGWSARSLISEHASDGEILLQAQTVPNWLVTYRSYKFPWVGLPNVPPDVVSRLTVHKSNGGGDGGDENNNINNNHNSSAWIKTEVFASWNGATEVKHWSLFKTDAEGKTKVPVATVPRNGFETQLVFDGWASYIKVQALDANHTVIEHGETPVIKTSIPEKPEDADLAAELDRARARETQWLQVSRYDDVHPWVLRARQSSTSPGVMFAAGILANAAALVVYRLFLRFTARRPSWWRQSAYLPKWQGE